MVLENLSNALKNTLQKIAKSLFVDEKLINELIKDIQRALLQADVNVKLVFDLTEKIKQRALNEESPKGLTKKEQIINIVYEELVNFLGKEQHKIELNQKPFKIMLVGLFGSGKTTTAGKLAKFYTKRGHKVALVGLDIHRPAAMEQIEQVGRHANVTVFLDKTHENQRFSGPRKFGELSREIKDPIEIWKKHIDDYKNFDILIIDTAGRDALSHDLINEIEEVNEKIQPNENLLIISADIGQAAQKQAEQFHKSCGITGIVVSKMDGTAKGGGALTACAVSGAPIKFIGIGEKIDDLEQFNPQGFVGRILGMGDLEALLEKAKEVIKTEDAEDLGKRFLKGEFNLIDLYEQMEAMSKMGPLSSIVEMIPGFSSLKLPKEMLQVQEGKLKKWKIAMNSMTKSELEEPDIIDSPRVERIAKGSGIQTSEIRELLKQYKQSKKMVKMFKGSKGDISKMMKKFGGKLPMGV
ncbi:signal recognition particle protein [Candidatus Woesearchaeota archaeon]|nr:signal recognition particle protein [Candidatus Woesearchaeota archaeon]